MQGGGETREQYLEWGLVFVTSLIKYSYLVLYLYNKKLGTLLLWLACLSLHDRRNTSEEHSNASNANIRPARLRGV